MAKRKSGKKRTRLPKGVRRRGQSLLVDSSVEVVRIAPNLVLFVRPPKKGKKRKSAARQMSEGTGWGSCSCDKSGACEPKIVFSPGGTKFTFTCVSKNCTGSCKLGAGTFPSGGVIAAAILKVVQG